MFSIVLATGINDLISEAVFFSWIADFRERCSSGRQRMPSPGGFSQRLIFEWSRAEPAIPSALRIAS